MDTCNVISTCFGFCSPNRVRYHMATHDFYTHACFGSRSVSIFKGPIKVKGTNAYEKIR